MNKDIRPQPPPRVGARLRLPDRADLQEQLLQRLDQILRNQVRMETRLVNLMLHVGLDSDGKPTKPI